MTERMKTWIKGFAGGVAVTVIVGGIRWKKVCTVDW